MMVLLVLARGGLVAVEAVHALPGVGAHLIFVDDGILRPSVALGTFPSRPNKLGVGLGSLHLRSCPIQQKCRQDKGKRDDYGQKH